MFKLHQQIYKIRSCEYQSRFIHSRSHFVRDAMLAIVAAVVPVLLLGWAYRAIQPPPPKICGSPGGPPIVSPRIQLRDGRFLAYKELGVPREKANYKIILVHGFADDKEFNLAVSQDLVDELGIYFLYFDRAGYGESDPNPKRTVKSDAMDVQELADQLGLGSKFYLIGVSMGGYPTYGCLNYIPHRLEGVAFVSPALNFWWPSFPADLLRKGFGKLFVQDQRTFKIAHHAPSLLYAWLTQKWLPVLSALQGRREILNPQDEEVVMKRAAYRESIGYQDKARQQGDFESLHRDLMIGFGKWEFDPMNMSNPFSRKGSVHLWHGEDDRMIPLELQRYVAKKLPWIHYHEIPEAGHMFIHLDKWSTAVVKALLLGQEHDPILG